MRRAAPQGFMQFLASLVLGFVVPVGLCGASVGYEGTPVRDWLVAGAGLSCFAAVVVMLWDDLAAAVNVDSAEG